MKVLSKYFLLPAFIFAAFGLNAQSDAVFRQLEKYGEADLAVARKDVAIEEFTRKVSVWKLSADSVFFNVNAGEFRAFLKSNVNYRFLKRKEYPLKSSGKTAAQIISSGFNNYPSYLQYDSIMHTFANTYPSICEYVNLGTLPSGRKIIALHIGDSVAVTTAEPRFLYTSTMHGDETAGYIFMLKLADWLLSNYGSDSTATKLVNSLDIWINPLANPDGTYHGGNASVWGAVRRNGNGIDLNRNYPDPEDGPHPDGNAYQPETNIFMAFADSMHFQMSANFHAGAEVVNYPWDTWSKTTADDSWWRFVSHEYADTAQYYNGHNGYFDDFGTGITNGYQWYTISGGRQDFMNYFTHCREVTVELSATKLLPENKLDQYWNWSKRSLINYMMQAVYALHGTVRDSATGLPLAAKVYISAHDKDSSLVYSHLPFGDYYRLLDSGYYSVTFSAPDYNSKTIDSVRIDRYQAKVLNVSLSKNINGMPFFIRKKKEIGIFPNPASDMVSFIYDKPGLEAVVRIYSQSGMLVKEKRIKSSGTIYSLDIRDLPQGVYYFSFATSCSKTLNGGKLIVKRAGK